MNKYKRYCLALNEQENDRFNKVKSKGNGIKKIFMDGLNVNTVEKNKTKEETE